MTVSEAGGGTENRSCSVVLSDAPMVAMIAMPSMLLSITFREIPTTVALLAPAVPPKIYPR